MAERDTYKYQLKEGCTTIYRGITYDLARRGVEHRKDHPSATIKQVGCRTTRESALNWQRNGGKYPYTR